MSSKLAECGGPPYFAPLWCYEQHLAHPGNRKIIDYNQQTLDLSRETTSVGGLGLSMLARVQNMESREEGETGNEWLSIWGPSLGSLKRMESSPHEPGASQDRKRKQINIKINIKKCTQAPADHSAGFDGTKDEMVGERLSSPRGWLLKRKVPGTGYAWDDIYSADA